MRNPSDDRTGRRRGAGRLALAALIALTLGGCGFFGSDAPPGPQAGTEGTAGAEAPADSSDPYAPGLLRAIVHLAPPGSNAQYLAEMADAMGWEADVRGDSFLREAVAEGEFEQRVMPRLLGLYFRKGFSVLPAVGEGHEFTRDTVIRGALSNSRYLVRAPAAVRIIFLEQVENIVLIYPKHGQQPQVFNRIGTSTVALRESRTEHYLN